MKKRIFSLLLALCMVLSLMPAAFAAGDFTDVPANEWYADEVRYVYENGLMNGVGGDKFDPAGSVSRAMVWTTLARMDGVNTAGADPWYLPGQQWAMANAVSDGTNPDGNITREQLVTMLYRYAQLKGYDVSVGEDTNILSYEDAFGISEWAIPAMQWACGAGVINGVGGKLLPQGNASRAELAVTLYRNMENVVKAEPVTPDPAPTPSTPVHNCVVISYAVTDPTCTERGYTTYFTCCGSCVSNYVDALDHAWGEWAANDDGTHTRVCGNDSTHTETEDCSYVEGGDVCECGFNRAAAAKIGETYYATVGAAISAAEAGNTIYLLAGTYDKIEFTNATADNLTLVGADDVYVGKIRLAKTQNYSAPDGLTLKNITFNGEGIMGSGENHAINGLSVVGCTFTNNAYIHLNGDCTVDGLIVENSTFDSTPTEKSSILVQGKAKNISIIGNTIANPAWNAVQLGGINGTAVINGNTITGTGSRAMRLTTKDGAVLTIQNNIITTANQNLAEATENNGEIIKISGVVKTGTFGGNTYNDEELVIVDGLGLERLSATPETLSAVIAAAHEGSIIQLAAGIYEEINFTNATADNLTLVGGEGVYIGKVRLAKTTNYSAPDGLTLQGITFNGEGIAASGAGHNIKNLSVIGCTFTGGAVIHINSSCTTDGLTVKNCTFEATNSAVNTKEKTAILVQGLAKNVEISENHITGSEFNAIQVIGINGVLKIDDNDIANTGSRAIRLTTKEGAVLTITNNSIATANTNPEEAAENGTEVIKISGAVTDGNLTANTYGDLTVTFVGGLGTYSNS